MEVYPDEQEFENLLTEIIDGGADTFLCGMARGFDLFAAEAVLKLKDEGKDLKLIACVPCPGQEKYFGKEEKDKYYEISSRCDEVKVLSDRYFKGCMQMRDRYMVDNSSTLIAYCRKDVGGTAFTVNYAVKKNKKIFKV